MEREKLIQARTRKHWTLEEAAEQIGVDYNTVYRWEHGLTTPRGRNLRQICEAYGVLASDLDLEQDNGKANVLLPPLTIAEETHAFIGNDLTMRLMALAFIPHRNFLELQDKLTMIIEEHDMDINTDVQLSRRDALRRLIALPLLTLKLNSSQPVLHYPVEDVLAQCAASIAACWELSKGSDETDLTLVGYRP